MDSGDELLSDELAQPDAGGLGLLSGVRVLDLTRLLPGAFCTQILADWGAEVVKIEQPGAGDYWRWAPPRVRRHSAPFLALNRGKRSMTLNLKSKEGRAVFLSLCETADIVLEGFRPGVMARLGLGPEVLHARNPRLVIGAMTGFGQEGPWAQVAAHDLNYLGLAGVLQMVTGRKRDPGVTALPVGDIGGGSLFALGGLLAALTHATRTGKGHFVDVSVVDSLMCWSGFMTSAWNVPGREAEEIPFDAPFDKPFYRVYETRDGRHLVVGAYEDRFWETLCRVLGHPEWIALQWSEGAEEAALRDDLAEAFRSKDLAEWVEIFAQHEACVTPVLTAREAAVSAHARARGSVVLIDDPEEGRLAHPANPLRIDGAAQNAMRPAPALGQDTDALLQEIGLPPETIEAFRAAEII